ncbi:hypothetical protein GCM10010495_14150 [Kitasatospora herbaricolor]|nr:hypothetical protein GCM10010495_14150 [Kitasatospora herbaricolor]
MRARAATGTDGCGAPEPEAVGIRRSAHALKAADTEMRRHLILPGAAAGTGTGLPSMHRKCPSDGDPARSSGAAARQRVGCMWVLGYLYAVRGA